VRGRKSKGGKGRGGIWSTQKFWSGAPYESGSETRGPRAAMTHMNQLKFTDKY